MLNKFFIVLITALLFLVGADFVAAQGGFGGGQPTQIAVPGGDSSQGTGGLIGFISSAINFILGLLGLIALIVLLWGGFQMVTAAGDEGRYGKGFTILKQAGLGLILIGTSWFIIEFIFSLIQGSAENTGGNVQ